MRRIIEALEVAFRHLVTYPLLRLLFRNPISNSPINLQNVRKLLILRYDRIGDMIVTTPVFRNLKRVRPDLYIGVVTSPANAELIRFNPHVDALYVLHSSWLQLLQEVLRARKENYDVVLNFIFNRTSSGGILANVIAPQGYKIGQGEDKYQFYFNRLLKLERSSAHMIETLAAILRQVFNLELAQGELEFEIGIDERSKASVEKFLQDKRLKRRTDVSANGKHYVVFNLSATDNVRRISPYQAVSLAQHLGRNEDFGTVLTYAPQDTEMRRVLSQILKSSGCLAFPDSGKASLIEVASLIEGALCVITPDTSIIHFASATKTPVVGFFTPMQGMHEWLPYRVRHDLVAAPTGKPVSAIPIEEMIQRVDGFIKLAAQVGWRKLDADLR